MTNLQSGQMFGPYKIIHRIGAGGMATVYKAYHASMDRYVALKILPHEFAHRKEFLGRFEQEIKVIAKLEHPHILPVYDCGESDGVPYLVMRYLDAGTLKDHISQGKLSLAEIDRFFSQFAEALGYAHAQGVIHRDIKPTNALVDQRGDIFLTDFGIAKLIEGSAHFTASGALVGTPAYMSPEQGQGASVDHRSDIYSLGIVLYEMLTGKVPYKAETPVAVILKKIQEPLPPPSAVNPEISPALEKVVLKALAKDMEDRFGSTTEFLQAWKKGVEGQLAAIKSQKGPALAGGQPLVDLPPALRQALESPFAGLREGAVSDLDGLLYDSNPGLANAAYEALRQLGDDQNESVSKAAAKRLTVYDRAQRQLRLAALYEHAQMSIQAEDWADARAVLTDLLNEEAAHKDASAQLRFVESKIKTQGIPEQAREEHIAKQSPKDIEATYGLGIQYYQAKQFGRALEAFQWVHSANPSYQNTARYIEVIEKQMTRQERAAEKPKRKIWPVILGGCGSLICIGVCILTWLSYTGYW
jgi:tRNA A-37 threonylcarbamoyl transferase component Bud32